MELEEYVMKILKRIFSIRNIYSSGEKIKILEFFGFKIKLYKKTQNTTDNILYLDNIFMKLDTNKIFSDKNKYSATVIVPIYNAYEHVFNLFNHVFERTNNNVKFIIINDNSTDEKIENLINNTKFDGFNVKYIKNDKNMGFTKTMNKAMNLVDTDYAIWLNTDVEVPYNWVERILYPFNENKKIASVTPFTNCGVYFSFPDFGKDNKLIDNFKFEDIDKAFSKISCKMEDKYEIHSGCGFCMAINMKCWNKIGQLDDINFDRGYGEECDWCQRAVEAGWKNVLVPNLFVYHKHGGSFQSEEKKKLIEEHYNILVQKHPGLPSAVKDFEERDPWKSLRALAAFNMCDIPQERKTYIWFDINADSGGACAYRDAKINDMKKNGINVILVLYSRGECTQWSVKLSYLDDMQILCKGINDVELLFKYYQIDKIIVDNLAFCEDTFAAIDFIKRMNEVYRSEIVYMFHDYFSICPSFFLLNKKTLFCNLNGCENKCICESPFACIKSCNDINLWREKWKNFFLHVNKFIFFSESTKKIVSKIYPIVENGDIIEHSPLCEFDTKYEYPYAETCLNIAFIGPFIPEKGSEYVIKLSKYINKNKINAKIFTFGNSYKNDENIQHTGVYKREELPKLLNSYKIKVVVFLSPWPETFSYVVQECMQMGVPVVCFDIGAPAERIRKYKYPYANIINGWTESDIMKAIVDLDNKMQTLRRD